MAYYLMLFAAGFAGSFHCIGMCGGFACALGRDPNGHGATVLRHLLYNTGRLTTYCFLGGLAGTLGQVICTPQGMTVSLMGGSLEPGIFFWARLFRDFSRNILIFLWTCPSTRRSPTSSPSVSMPAFASASESNAT